MYGHYIHRTIYLKTQLVSWKTKYNRFLLKILPIILFFIGCKIYCIQISIWALCIVCKVVWVIVQNDSRGLYCFWIICHGRFARGCCNCDVGCSDQCVLSYTIAFLFFFLYNKYVLFLEFVLKVNVEYIRPKIL